jgi:hypothetical protein
MEPEKKSEKSLKRKKTAIGLDSKLSGRSSISAAVLFDKKLVPPIDDS